MKINDDFILQLLLLITVPLVTHATAGSYPASRVAPPLVAHATAVSDSASYSSASKVVDDEDISSDLSLEDTDEEYFVKEQWTKHRKWNYVYKKKRDKYRQGSTGKIVFVSMGAALQFFALNVPPKFKAYTSICAGTLAYIGIGFKDHFFTKGKLQDMNESYYNSNLIMSEVWKYRTQVGEYSKSRADSTDEALEKLKEACGKITISEANKRLFLAQDPDPKKKGKRKTDPPPFINSKSDFFDVCVDKMSKRYLKQAKFAEMKAKKSSNFENVLLHVGGIGAFLTATPNEFIRRLTVFVGACTVASTLIGSHTLMMKYDDIATRYYKAADDLQSLKSDWPSNTKKCGDHGWEENIFKFNHIMLSAIADCTKLVASNAEKTE